MENITNNSITQKNVDLEIKEFFEALSQMPKKSKCGRKKTDSRTNESSR